MKEWLSLSKWYAWRLSFVGRLRHLSLVIMILLSHLSLAVTFVEAKLWHLSLAVTFVEAKLWHLSLAVTFVETMLWHLSRQCCDICRGLLWHLLGAVTFSGIVTFVGTTNAQCESFFKHYTRPHISFYKIRSKHSLQDQEHHSTNRGNKNK